jgi:AraC-like DNA-binding protein
MAKLVASFRSCTSEFASVTIPMSDGAELHPSKLYFRLVVHHLGASDARLDVVLEGTGVSAADVDNPRVEIYYPQFMRLIANVDRERGEGWFLAAPDLWTTSSLRPLGVAAISAQTFGGAAELIARHLSFGLPQHRLRLLRRSTDVLLRYWPIAPIPQTEDRFLACCLMLALRELFGKILGSAAAKLSSEFASGEPPYAMALAERLGGRVCWSAPNNAIVIPEGLMEFRSLLADPVLHQAAVERLEEAKRRPPSDGVRGRVERLLARSDSPRMPFDEAAQALALSPRSLARRLDETDVTYRDLVDSELKKRARRWLDAGVLSQMEIAERLGFADATGFSRACRRWFRARS